jgi:stalled ribosome alternative rescue factor ArfA
MKKKNFIAKNLKSPKYRPRVVKSKKGKGSFKRKKNNLSKSRANLLNHF